MRSRAVCDGVPRVSPHTSRSSAPTRSAREVLLFLGMTTSNRIVRPVLVAAVAVADDVLVLREAWQRAIELGHTLVVCSVVADDEARPATEAWLRELIAGLGESPVQVAIDVRVGDRTDALLACTNDHHAELLVLGATSQREGFLARLFDPALPTTLVRAATIPLLVVRPPHGDGPVLGATDLGDPTWPVLRTAVSEATRGQAPVLVIHCVTTPPMTVTDGVAAPIVSVEELTRSAGGVLAEAAVAAGLPPTGTRVEFGSPSDIVVRKAAELDARLVVIGSHGGSGATRFLLGSVAETILRQVPCSVMVVPLNRNAEAASAA